MEATTLIIPAGDIPTAHPDRAVGILPQAMIALPPAIVEAGEAAWFAWDEFFAATIRNPHTLAAYSNAVRQFFAWLTPRGVAVHQITPGMVGLYFSKLSGSTPTRKLHLAALRALFDVLVVRHVMPLNPAASVRTERYQVIEGKTPEITILQARTLLATIRVLLKDDLDRDVPSVVGLRDRAIIAMLIYTAARAGAVARLTMRDFQNDGSHWVLRFAEKGGKSREIPVRHDLETFILAYLAVAPAQGTHGTRSEAPLFRTAERRTGNLTLRPMTNIDVCRMVKRRLHDAGLPTRLSPHSFRVATITDLLTQGVSLEDVQHLAGHADPRTTRLYDRRQKRVTRNIVERISV